MSEYWVSQAKKHCDFCKCWIADNKPSRDFHERGKRHQDNVKKKIEEVRKSSVKKAQKEEEMNDSLREMNENAMKALRKDLMANPSLASQYGVKLKPKEPVKLPEYGPAPRPESHEADKDDSESDSEDTSDKEETPPTATVTSTVGTWHMAASDAGYPYYWNDITSEVSWVPPPAYLAQQAGQGTSQEEPQEHSRTPSPEPPVKKKKKKRSKELEEPVATNLETAKQRSKEPEEPVAKKPKTEKAEPVIIAEIPLPCDIPLPPPPGTEKGEEDDKTEVKEEEEQEKEESSDSDEDATKAKPRRPKSSAAYGTWEQIEEEPRMEDIDLGLPEVKEEPVVTIPVAEPKLKFREKTVSSLGSGPVFFKKPKKKMTAAQFLKKREDS